MADFVYSKRPIVASHCFSGDARKILPAMHPVTGNSRVRQRGITLPGRFCIVHLYFVSIVQLPVSQ
jgi:hypothetical protein